MNKIEELTLETLREKYIWASIKYNTKTNVYECFNYFGRYLFSYDTLEQVDANLNNYINGLPYECNKYSL